MESSLTAGGEMRMNSCRLCASPSVTLFHTDKMREYYRCHQCSLVFVPDRFMLSSAEEKAVYDLHENIPGDAAYEKFLSRAAQPLADYLSAKNHSRRTPYQPQGLDFGCGPAPVLAKILSAAPYNFSMDVFDLYYFPETRYCLERAEHYDFITATEVVEHLRDPLSVFRTLWHSIRPDGGVLVIMTKRVHGTIERFRNWHYTRDPTHITFFHTASFQWLADSLPSNGETCETRFVSADVALLIKRKSDS
ncbi:hypothetical protein LMJF_10_1228 [Leishmania major strain Friedlin]|uniref:Methyltransferase-like protein n=1 Tax=Leishmania major TaxID=5664 RepID=E9ACR1_LEIMA|nr:hypothetical protein LMJF_10_1228 [Leishmania major strain Friedlin]CAG9570112.1 Methyltransferase_domain_containing_protein_-_putative [Leishmania major strain Friedlin]CBZ05801.1 hypothetical protein LMJF_10_1228 [Leishmania major strain Friedlin]|eukprot:XP_003721785.1 hypothetical protein LMJF_10_1228 [Leishmania major strain Friedlin]